MCRKVYIDRCWPSELTHVPRSSTVSKPQDTLLSMNSFCLFLNFVSMEPNSMYPFVSGLFHSASCVQDSSMTLHAGEVHFGSVLLLSHCVSLPQFTCPLLGACEVFSVRAYYEECFINIPACVFCWIYAAISVGRPWRMELLVIGTCMFNVSRCFRWMYPLPLPPAMGKCSSYSIHMLANA